MALRASIPDPAETPRQPPRKTQHCGIDRRCPALPSRRHPPGTSVTKTEERGARVAPWRLPPYRHRVRTGRRRARIIRRDPLVAVQPKDFRRQPDGTVTLQDLAGTGLVWFSHDQLPLIRAGILSAFRQAGHPVDIVLDVNRTLTVISCVAAGCGVSLLPHSIHTFAFEGGRL